MPGCLGVVQQGTNGQLVPPRAPGALAAAAILELPRRPGARAGDGQTGRALVRDRFSLDSIAAQYASLYRTLARPGDLDQAYGRTEAR